MSYQAQAEKMGFKIVPREEVFSKNCIIAHDNTALDQEESRALRQRVELYPGRYVIFNPEADAEAFVLVGDDKEALAMETVRFETDMAS